MTHNGIPTKSRYLVRTRALGRCLRCGGPGAQWHHRRSRGVREPHRHCPCNGVWLCPTCHRWAHANPRDAWEEGMILPRHTARPYAWPVVTFFGYLVLDCDGTFSHHQPQTFSD